MLVHNALVQFKVSKQLKRSIKAQARRNKLGLSAAVIGEIRPGSGEVRLRR